MYMMYMYMMYMYMMYMYMYMYSICISISICICLCICICICICIYGQKSMAIYGGFFCWSLAAPGAVSGYDGLGSGIWGRLGVNMMGIVRHDGEMAYNLMYSNYHMGLSENEDTPRMARKNREYHDQPEDSRVPYFQTQISVMELIGFSSCGKSSVINLQFLEALYYPLVN